MIMLKNILALVEVLIPYHADGIFFAANTDECCRKALKRA
jgi:hypothetical protein